MAPFAGALACLQTVAQGPLGFRCDSDADCNGVGFCSQQTCQVCGPGNCPGCCASPALCLPGSAADGCGSDGGACTACGSGVSCVQGQCQSCGPANCSGCCTAGGTCVGGQDVAACGDGGVACTGCGAGQICDAGTCVDHCTAPQTRPCPAFCGLQHCGSNGQWLPCPTCTSVCPCFCNLPVNLTGYWCGKSAQAFAEDAGCALTLAQGNDENLLACENNTWFFSQTCTRGCNVMPGCNMRDVCN